MKKSAIAAILLTTTFSATGLLAAPVEGTREVTLSGAGGSDKDFETNTFTIDGSYAYYFAPNTAAGVRQSVSVADREGQESQWNGSTRVFYDYLFGDVIRPFVGANIGYIYGDFVEESFIAGPELGLKHYVLQNTFVNVGIEYQFIFEDADEADNAFDDGAFAYSLGIGFNF